MNTPNSIKLAPPAYQLGCYLISRGQYEQGLNSFLDLQDFSPAKNVAETIAHMALDMRHLDYAYIAAWISGNLDLQEKIEKRVTNEHKSFIDDIKLHTRQGRESVKRYYTSILLPRGHDIPFYQNN